MLLAAQRQAIVRACRELSATGLVVGTAGNVSVRSGDLVAVTPSGMAYADMAPGHVGVHRLDAFAQAARVPRPHGGDPGHEVRIGRDIAHQPE